MTLDMQEILMDIRERLVGVETQLIALTRTSENYNRIETKVVELEACSKTTSDRVKVLEKNSNYLWKLVIGAIITAGLALIIKGG